jgi:glycosyltransferase involved in cell wall biosynthesis
MPMDTSGVGAYRCLFPGRELALHGHEVTMPWRDRFGKRYEGALPVVVGIAEDGSIEPWFDADVYVLQQRMEHLIVGAPGGEWSMADVVRWLRGHGKVVVSDVCDWYPGLPDGNLGSDGLRRLGKHLSVEGMLETFRASDCLTVSTPALAEGHASDNGDVRVLPPYLDWRMWEGVRQQSEVERPDGRVRVGWMGALAFHPDDLNVLRGAIGPWLERNPRVDFVSVGEPQPGNEPDGYVSVHDVLGVPRGRRVSVNAAPFAELPKILPSFDIGLVPLDGSFFNECKSHLKGLEYSACGIVPVASPTEPYRSFIRDGESGFLARRAKDWLRALDALVSDDELRRRMGRAARAEAAKHTIQEHYVMWEECYAGLAGATDLEHASEFARGSGVRRAAEA